ncbi:MAG TPA: hypothetical protein PLV59_01080 [Candidatus Dojkabacteria bacterium]|nr:hypothetical protein [Candidatus Dojkabacteria bacterium]
MGSLTVAANDGPDGGGKLFLTKGMVSKVLTCDTLTINGDEPINPSELFLLSSTFPGYAFLGQLTRKCIEGAGDDFIEVNHLSFEEELNLRKAPFALERFITTAVAHQLAIENPEIKNTLWINDRFHLAQFNTHGFMGHRHGSFNGLAAYNSQVLDADIELDRMLSPITIMCLPKSASNLAQFKGQRSVEAGDPYEAENAQEFAIKGYQFAVENFPRVHLLETQDVDGKWLDGATQVDKMLGMLGIIANGGSIDISEQHLIDHWLHSQYDRGFKLLGPKVHLETIFPIFKSLSGHHVQWIKDRMFEWEVAYMLDEPSVIARYSDLPEFSTLKNKDKKSILKVMERIISFELDGYLEKFRVDPRFLKDVDPNIIRGMRRLAGPYTKGMLLPYLQTVSRNAGLGNGYINMLIDFLNANHVS